MTHRFFKMAAATRQFYFLFCFGNFAQLGRSKFTCILNFGDISQSAVEILLLPVFKTNVRLVGILLPVSIFIFTSSSL